MWLRSVTPGGGYLPAGTVLRLSGGGFDATTKVAVDGVSIATQQLIDQQHIELTLGGATEMTAKHVIVTDGSGERQEFFTAIPSAPSASVSPFPGVFPIVPLNVSQKIVADSTIPSNSAVQNGLALMNQKLEPVTVTFLGTPYFSADYSQLSVTVPPSSMYFLRLNTLSDGQVPARSTSRYWIGASAPIRMLTYSSKVGQNVNFGVPGENPTDPPTVSLQIYPDTVTWSWQAGKAAPSSATISISPIEQPFTAASSVPWIQLSQSQGTLTLTPNLTGLAPGAYSATVTATPVLPPNVTGLKVQPSTIHVTLTVSAAPLLTAPYCCAFMTFGPGIPPNGTSLPITSNGDPVPFTITTSGEPWLSLNLDRGTTPATLVPTAILAGLQPGYYTAQIFVHGPTNTLNLSVNLTISSSRQTVPQLQVSPPSLRFVLEAGTPGPLGSPVLTTSVNQPVTFTVHILSGGDWLTTEAFGNRILTVNASAVGLGPGDYAAQVIVSSEGYSPVTVPVSLTVLPVPASATFRVSPAAVSLSGNAAVEQDATLTIDSTAGPALVQASISASSSWLHFGVQSAYTAADGKFTTPATLTIYANSGQPGTFRGAITIQTTNNSVTVPVTLDATPSPTKPPQIASVVNAASGLPGALAPGEIFSLFGLGVGGTLLVNGVPAPLLYTSSGQVNAVVPFEAGTSGIAKVKIAVAGVSSAEWGIPLAPAAPAIFTLNASGAGPGAVLNQDYSVNSAANPAAHGSIIQIFGTGQGVTSPPSLTGAVSTGAGNSAVLPVKVTIGGIDAIVQYQGAAPGLISGSLQVNAFVPPDVTPGIAVPLSISIGGLASQPGVTIAVR
jgi:trimeric autotransporter adhesin